jgi:hypothetical protein
MEIPGLRDGGAHMPKNSETWTMIQKHTGILPDESQRGIWTPIHEVQPRANEVAPAATSDSVPVHGARLKSAIQNALKHDQIGRFGSSSGEGIWISEDTVGPIYPLSGGEIGPVYPSIIRAARSIKRD